MDEAALALQTSAAARRMRAYSVATSPGWLKFRSWKRTTFVELTTELRNHRTRRWQIAGASAAAYAEQQQRGQGS